MKYMMNKYLRMGIILVLILCIGITSFLTYKVLYSNETVESKNPLYTYNSKGQVNYSVFLKPNKINEGKIQGEDEVYIMEYVDYMDIAFNYEFQGEQPADISGDYTISAIIEGYVGNDENRKIIWDKEFPLTGRKMFNSNDGHINLKENIKLALQSYNDFGTEIAKETKIDSQNIMTVVMNINLKGLTDKGEIVEVIKPSIMFPINSPMFEVSGNKEFDNPGAIVETIMIPKPLEINILIFHAVILGILVIGLILLLLLTKGQAFTDPMERQLRLIFRKHGDRMVALDSAIIAANPRVVRSIDDLIRIADELGKPILYKYSDNYKDMTKFYVINEEEKYVLDIEEVAIEETREKEVTQEI